MECYCCGDNEGEEIRRPDGWPYYRCGSCGSIYTACAKPVMVTDNDKPWERNSDALHTVRLERIIDALGYIPKCVMDKGCGNGEFVEFLRKKNIKAYGYDVTGWYKNELCCYPVDVVTMIEVIEHLKAPCEDLKFIGRYLEEGGVVYIETTFADQIEDPSTDPYVDPTIGHINIMSKDGFMHVKPSILDIHKWINDNVVILRKPV